MKYGIKVLPKKEVLDSQGRATQKVLEEAGFKVESLSVGRYIELDTNISEAEILKMAEYVLYNPLIENLVIDKKESL